MTFVRSEKRLHLSKGLPWRARPFRVSYDFAVQPRRPSSAAVAMSERSRM